MDRRRALTIVSASSWGLLAGSCATHHAGSAPAWEEILRRHGCEGARLGVAIPDTRRRSVRGWHEDERFPLCSTFKVLLAAAVLARIDAGKERAERRVRIRSRDILAYAPVTARNAGASLTIDELCAAAVSVSDNTAANLLLATIGGPQGLTRRIRQWGDTVTRLDRWEPDLNESRPGDPRDTTTPRAMVQLLETLLLRDALKPSSRQRLLAWMHATTTNRNRLASRLPSGWTVASKTGTGDNGSTNDAGILFPPGRPPAPVAIFLTETGAPLARREAVLAEIAHSITSDW